MQLLKGLSFPHRACPREGVGRESTLQADYLTWIPVFTGIQPLTDGFVNNPG